MARIRLSNSDIVGDVVPDLCLCCGEPASCRPQNTFRWNPGWVYIILFLLGLWPFIIVALFVSWSRRVVTPFCDRHAGYWRFRTWYVVGGLAVLILIGMAVGIAIAEADPVSTWQLGAWVGFAAVALVWLFSAAIMQATSIRPAEITADRITLVGVHPEFAAELRRRQDEQAANEVDPTVRH